MSFTRQTAIILWKVRSEPDETFNHQTTDCRYPGVLPSLTDIASNCTAYSNLLIIDCKSAYYVEILLRLEGAVCRQRTELWPTAGYMKLRVDRNLNCGWQLVTWSCVQKETWTVTESWFHEDECGQRLELWPIFGSSVVKVCVVTGRTVSSNLWRKVQQ